MLSPVGGVGKRELDDFVERHVLVVTTFFLAVHDNRECLGRRRCGSARPPSGGRPPARSRSACLPCRRSLPGKVRDPPRRCRACRAPRPSSGSAIHACADRCESAPHACVRCSDISRFSFSLLSVAVLSLLCSNARCRANVEVLRLEAVSDDLRHLVVDPHLLLRVGNRDDQREWLRLERLLVLDSVPREELELQPPASRRAHLSRRDLRSMFGPEPICGVFPPGRTRRAVPTFLCSGGTKPTNLVLTSACLTRLLSSINTKVRVDVGLAVFGAPSRAPRGRRKPPSSRSHRNTFRPGAATVDMENHSIRENSRA